MFILGLRGPSGGRAAQESGSWECATRNICHSVIWASESCGRGALPSEWVSFLRGGGEACARRCLNRDCHKLTRQPQVHDGERPHLTAAFQGFSRTKVLLSFGWRSDLGAVAVEPRSPPDQRLGYQKSLEGGQMKFRFLRKYKGHSHKGGKVASSSRAPTCY